MKAFIAKLLGLLPWDGSKTVIGTIVWLITHYAVVIWPAFPWAELVKIIEFVAAAFGTMGVLHWRLKADLAEAKPKK